MKRWGARLREDDGTTLVESILAVAIMGIAMAAILTGILTLVRESDRSEEQARANVVLVAVTEALRGPSVAYNSSCAPEPYAISDTALASWGVTLPSGWDSTTVEIESVRYWSGSAFDTTCEDSDPYRRLQELTVRVTDPDDRASAAMAVVKRGE